MRHYVRLLAPAVLTVVLTACSAGSTTSSSDGEAADLAQQACEVLVTEVTPILDRMNAPPTPQMPGEEPMAAVRRLRQAKAEGQAALPAALSRSARLAAGAARLDADWDALNLAIAKAMGGSEDGWTRVLAECRKAAAA